MRRMRGLVDGLRFAEGLRWHGNALWFSDMLDKRVYRCTMAGQLDVALDGVDQPSGLGFHGDSVVVVERGTGAVLVAGDDGVPSLYADLAGIGTVRPNDMVTTDNGWRYVGSLGHEYELGEEKLGHDGNFNGTLVAISPERDARVVADGLGCPNAMVMID